MKFHSQVAHRAELVPAGVCGLCPPAPTNSFLPQGLPQDDRSPWGRGREAAGRAGLVPQPLSFV